MVDIQSSNQQNIVEISNSKAKYYSDLASQSATKAEECLNVMLGIEGEALDEMKNEIVENLLSNGINIPTNVSELQNDCGYLTEVPDEYVTETELFQKGYITEIPSGYITEDDLANMGLDISSKADKVDTYTKTEVGDLISSTANTPFTLLEHKLSENQLYNTSWLLSNGQYNDGNVYIKAYEALQVEINEDVAIGSTVTLPSGTEYIKRGLSVVNSTDTYTDYDFVLDTANEQFRLPLKLSHTYLYAETLSTLPVKGNGNSIGLIVGDYKGGVYKGNGTMLYINSGYYNKPHGSGYPGGPGPANGDLAVGLTTYADESGIIADLSDVTTSADMYLYFYVGETVQNANLINAGRLAEQLAEKTDLSQAATASMPSNSYINLTFGASGTTYTAPNDGWYVLCKAGTGVQFIQLINLSSEYTIQTTMGGNTYVEHLLMPVKKNDEVQLNYNAGGATVNFKFIYAEGAN